MVNFLYWDMEKKQAYVYILIKTLCTLCLYMKENALKRFVWKCIRAKKNQKQNLCCGSQLLIPYPSYILAFLYLTLLISYFFYTLPSLYLTLRISHPSYILPFVCLTMCICITHMHTIEHI